MESRSAARDSGVVGTTAAGGRSNGEVEAGVAPGDGQDASLAATQQVGDARSAAIDQRPVRVCGMCKREGTVGFHPEPHHHDKRTGRDVFICVSRRACRSRWRKNLRRRSYAVAS